VTSLVLTNIGQLVTNDPTQGRDLAILTDAAVLVENGLVVWAGPMRWAPAADTAYDVGGRAVIPGFVDSHAHLMFAGDRAAEFESRMTGRPYLAGGIHTTVEATRKATDEELEANLVRLLGEMQRQGTTTVEVKSGYGLTAHDESRALAIASRYTQETTYLGAHVVPKEYADDPDGYVDLVTGSMLEACAPYAKWVDVFCERGAFGVEQARAILTAGRAKQLGARLHANQLGPGPGVQLAAELGLQAVDHCTYLDDDDIRVLADSGCVATLLPGVEFSTRSPYPPARTLLDAGCTVALATDCNPGSCYTSSMPFCIALAVREMRMSPAEALRAATMGGAQALGRIDVGHLGLGTPADLVVLEAPSYVHLAYRPGVNLVRQVFIAGVPA